MLLLVGLGNPGEKYARHRHNIGFMAADAIADAHGFSDAKSKFRAAVREGFVTGEGGRSKALILKPLTYMNDSGQSVGEAARFYKIDPENVIVFYDELDLAPGKLRMKTGGGAAGHNGIRSIDAHLGNGFRRVRIGIGHPGDKSRVTNHVLGDFSKSDRDWLEPMLDAIASEASFLSSEDNNRFQTAVAHRLAPVRPAKKPVKSANADGETKTAARPKTDASAKPKTEDQPAAKNPFSALGGLFKRDS